MLITVVFALSSAQTIEVFVNTNEYVIDNICLIKETQSLILETLLPQALVFRCYDVKFLSKFVSMDLEFVCNT
jgi:hypothetical protein